MTLTCLLHLLSWRHPSFIAAAVIMFPVLFRVTHAQPFLVAEPQHQESQVIASTCTLTQTSTAEITVCIENPLDNATITGVETISVTMSTTGSVSQDDTLVASLNGNYLLTDYRPPFTFDLPSQAFSDGWRTLSIVVYIGDNLRTNPTSIDLQFRNGNLKTPVSTRHFTPYTGSPPAQGEPFVVAATGDGASGERPEVTDLIASWNPDMFLYLGDVYERGTYTEFYNWYGTDEYFGQFRAITNPTVGNHEYENGEGPGYFTYWDNVPDYYSFEAAGWHFISLNSMLREMEAGTPQYDWLVEDLNASDARCKLAFFHHPRYSIGTHGDTAELNAVWRLLVGQGVDIVLTGHDHNYQRWESLDGRGRPDPNGAVQFVAGSGGHGVRGFERRDERVVYGNDTPEEAYGALRLELYDGYANFEYINAENSQLDSGEVSCDD